MLDLTYPPLWHYRYEHDMAQREARMPEAQAQAAAAAAGSAGLSASMAMAKAAPPMPGDDDQSSSSSSGNGGHRMGDDPPLPRRNPDDDDDSDPADEESGLPLGIGGAGGAGGAAAHEDHEELSFFQSIFAFVWGHGRPTCADGASFESLMWTALANRIRANGGTVLAEECKAFVLDEEGRGSSQITVGQQLANAYGSAAVSDPDASSSSASSSSAPVSASAQAHVSRHSDSDAREEPYDIDEHGPLLSRAAPPASIADPNARYMMPILAHFGGHTVVSPDGRVIAYTFPIFFAQHHRLREAGQLNGQARRPEERTRWCRVHR